MSDFIELLILVLGAWRITQLLVNDGITQPLRRFLGVEFVKSIEDLETVIYNDGVYMPSVEMELIEVEIPHTLQTKFIGKVLTCVFCASIWVSFFIMFFVVIFGVGPVALILSPFALSTAVISVNRFTVD